MAKLWRQDMIGVLDSARLARDLLPPSGRDVPDAAHWQAVRERAEQTAQSLERLDVNAPTTEAADAARGAAAALRGSVFALESDRLLRDGAQPPTAEQLADADTVIRARASELDASLEALDRMVESSTQGGGGTTAVGS